MRDNGHREVAKTNRPLREGMISGLHVEPEFALREERNQKEKTMKQMNKLVILGVAALGLSVCQSNASLFTTLNSGIIDGHSYYVVTTSDNSVISWAAAEAGAVSMGGTLASITDSAENTYVYNLITSSILGTSSTVWFGGKNPSGPTAFHVWSWANGATWAYAPWATAQGQPDAAESFPDYTVFWSGGGPNWGDAGDSWALTSGNAHSFVVEVVPEPTTMVAGALLLLPFGMSTLRMLRKSRTA